jgi:hypothetical protein
MVTPKPLDKTFIMRGVSYALNAKSHFKIK